MREGSRDREQEELGQGHRDEEIRKDEMTLCWIVLLRTVSSC